MRFERSKFPRNRPVEINKRKIKSAERRNNIEAESLPLFAELIRETQESPETRARKQLESSANYFRNLRNYEANNWREFRKLLKTLPENQQRQFIRIWDSKRCPGTAVYAIGDLKDFIKTLNIPRIKYDEKCFCKCSDHPEIDLIKDDFYGQGYCPECDNFNLSDQYDDCEFCLSKRFETLEYCRKINNVYPEKVS
jgi:hypothetical protein